MDLFFPYINRELYKIKLCKNDLQYERDLT